MLVCEQRLGCMTLDNEGNLYLTGDGVLVIDKASRQIERGEVPDEPWTANVSFGGKDKQTLFITVDSAWRLDSMVSSIRCMSSEGKSSGDAVRRVNTRDDKRSETSPFSRNGGW